MTTVPAAGTDRRQTLILQIDKAVLKRKKDNLGTVL